MRVLLLQLRCPDLFPVSGELRGDHEVVTVGSLPTFCRKFRPSELPRLSPSRSFAINSFSTVSLLGMPYSACLGYRAVTPPRYLKVTWEDSILSRGT